MIKKINRFERILKTREKVRDDERMVLSREKSEEERLVSLIDSLGSEKDKALNSFGAQGDESCTVEDLWFRRRAIDLIQDRICLEGDSLCSVRQAIVDSEARLLEKHKDVKVMEKYISIMVDDWQEEGKRQEQSELDDMAGIRHGALKEEGL